MVEYPRRNSTNDRLCVRIGQPKIHNYIFWAHNELFNILGISSEVVGKLKVVFWSTALVPHYGNKIHRKERENDKKRPDVERICKKFTLKERNILKI